MARSQAGEAAEFSGPFAAVQRVRVLRLRRNLGHQRAIAIGLVHVQQAMACDAVIIMDADGEDTAEGALQLLEAYTGDAVVFAGRARRTESLVFRLFYQLYKGLHFLLTGIAVRVGNFSLLPVAFLDTLVVMSEMWNHYAGAVFRSGLPFGITPIARGHRIAGRSRMNFVSLTAHGMSAISVFGDIVGVRLLILSMLASLLVVVLIAGVMAAPLVTGRPIPSWAGYSLGALVIVLVQLLALTVSFTFTMLGNRINLSFVPLRDAELFVAGATDLYYASLDAPPSGSTMIGYLDERSDERV